MSTEIGSRSLNAHIKDCYCVCHSPISGRPSCEHCTGDNEVARDYQRRLRESLLSISNNSEHRGFTEDEWREKILGDELQTRCYDCLRPYGNEHGFPDLVIPDWAWKKISPKRNEGGLLCPSCICKRLKQQGIRCEGAFTSGPIISVSEQVMWLISKVNNLEKEMEKLRKK